jgi:hypothetical protein
MTSLIWAGAGLAGVGMICWAALKAWRGWLDLKRYEIAAEREAARGGGGAEPTTGARIEMADIRERLRKLEAIATGVDL